MTNRYALADYQITVSLPDEINARMIARNAGLGNMTSLTIGGPGEGEGKYGSFVGSITAKRTKDLWTTEGDPTGSWVHSKNLDRTGTVEVELTQVSDQTVQLAYLCDAYESVQDAVGGLHIEIKNIASGEKVVDAIDCYINKLPDLPLKDTASRLTWTFTCGRVMFYI